MILVLSRSGDLSTDTVCDWLTTFGGRYLRINEPDLRTQYVPFALRRGKDGNASMHFSNGSLAYSPDEINVVWYRKWFNPINFDQFFDLTENKIWASTLVNHMQKEESAVSEAFFDTLSEKHWLNNPSDVGRQRKQKQLDLAVKAGLQVPDSLITNSREEARRFLAEKGNIITKPLSNVIRFDAESYVYLSYTREVTDELLSQSSEFFFPSLFQELIEKRADIRVFYMDGKVYAMAILSQADRRTSVDFRNYIHDRPSRTLPYQLPASVVESIRSLMKALGLANGSIDLILSRKREHIFLEVNPTGQFGMTSIPCNYQLEKIIAQYLMEHDKQN